MPSIVRRRLLSSSSTLISPSACVRSNAIRRSDEDLSGPSAGRFAALKRCELESCASSASLWGFSFGLAALIAESLSGELKNYLHYYNHDRIKQKLKGLSPVQYRAQTLVPS
ncbi:hypothetical protein LCGC14_0109360 [marine sediment metagenome]|uniref:Integrase catalytic domain-containing protein n=1 Tax=marine sediment metagenome TaxID=412755 RepID=A0A0F9YC14_9ZZZZ